jgi:DNA-binding MarR family transcriptional regulator
VTKKLSHQANSVSRAAAGAGGGERLARAVRQLAGEMDRLDQAAAGSLGVHRTDLSGLELLERRGAAMTAGELAGGLGLTTGAVTLLIDRLERAGFVTRRRDLADRRKVYVEVTPTLQARTRALFGGVGRATRALTDSYTAEQLDLIAGFVDRLTGVVTAEADAISNGNAAAGPGGAEPVEVG